MDALQAHVPDTVLSSSGGLSFQELLKQALADIAQGHYSEGVALVALAREQLSEEQQQFAPVFDSIIVRYSGYEQAQESLLYASRAFVQADSELKASVAQLESLALYVTSPVMATQTKQHAVIPLFSHVRHDPVAHNNSYNHEPLREDEYLPALTITCFGRFEVCRQQQAITLCQNRSGQAILRYLIMQSGYRATADALMEALWPADEPETARRKLQVAVSALRRSLNAGYECDAGGGYILYKNHLYLLHPSVQVVTDVDAFVRHYEAGQCSQSEGMVAQYEQACQLYSGSFLPEDLYADWSQRRREQLSQMYVSMCASLAEHTFKQGTYERADYWAHLLLAENPCDEAAHRLLMQTYTRQGRRNEALKQYQRCERILRDELGVAPMPETQHVFQDILCTLHEQK